jgi:Flp pilus assembly protein TadG
VTLSDKLRSRWLLRGEAGASAVELALILPLLILLIFGIVQFSIAYNRVQGLQAAAREGARFASIGGNFTGIQTRVHNAQSLFDDSDVTVTTSPPSAGTAKPCAAAGAGNDVTVTASVPTPNDYDLEIPLFGSYEINYNAAGVFRCEKAS